MPCCTIRIQELRRHVFELKKLFRCGTVGLSGDRITFPTTFTAFATRSLHPGSTWSSRKWSSHNLKLTSSFQAELILNWQLSGWDEKGNAARTRSFQRQIRGDKERTSTTWRWTYWDKKRWGARRGWAFAFRASSFEQRHAIDISTPCVEAKSQEKQKQTEHMAERLGERLASVEQLSARLGT